MLEKKTYNFFCKIATNETKGLQKEKPSFSLFFLYTLSLSKPRVPEKLDRAS